MTIQINPIVSPRIITVPEADGVSITVQSLVNQIRDWEDDQASLSYPKLLAAAGKEDLGGGTAVGITATLENTKLKFGARASPTTCYVGGGNLVAIDANGDSMFPIEPSTNVTVQLSQSSSATLVQSDDIETMRLIQMGAWKIDKNTNQMILYGSDGITPLRTFDLFDKDGNPASERIYERRPV